MPTPTEAGWYWWRTVFHDGSFGARRCVPVRRYAGGLRSGEVVVTLRMFINGASHALDEFHGEWGERILDPEQLAMIHHGLATAIGYHKTITRLLESLGVDATPWRQDAAAIDKAYRQVYGRCKPDDLIPDPDTLAAMRIIAAACPYDADNNRCRFCGHQRGEAHDRDCPWPRAQEKPNA